MTENNSFPVENYTLPPDYLLNRDPLHIVIPLTVIYTIIFFTGLIGNVSTCVVIAHNKHMHTATNYYLFSLAISDILLLLSGLPAETFMLWSKHTYVFGESVCILKGLVAETSANATVLTITAFTVERYVAICHPFRSHSLSKLSRAVRLVVIIWVAALTLAVPLAIQFGVIQDRYLYVDVSHCDIKSVLFEKAFILSSFIVFVVPMTVIIVLYILIGLKLRLSGRMSGKRPSINTDREAATCSRASTHQRHVINMLVAVVVTFFICWAPFHAQRLFAMYMKSLQSPNDDPTLIIVYESLLHISGILYYLSTTVNPLLYNLMSHKFRLAFKSTLSRGRHNINSEKRSPNGTMRQSSLRTPTGSTDAGSTRRKRQVTGMVVLTSKNSRFVRFNSQPTISSCLESRKHSADSFVGDRISENNGRLNETTISSSEVGQCSRSVGDGEKQKRDLTLSCITQKIKLFPRRKKLCFSNKPISQESAGLGNEKNLSSGEQSISNSSLLDLDLSEFTSSELAEIMGQLKEEPQLLGAEAIIDYV